ncbi:4736_t:CDS:1, partial [Ambispora leptoticha]
PMDNLLEEFIKASGTLQYLRIEGDKRGRIDRIFPAITLNSRNLRAINLRNFDIKSLPILMQLNPNLYHLEVYTKNLDDTFFNMLARELLPTIKSLRLVLQKGDTLEMSEESFIHFLEVTHQNLKYLSLHPLAFKKSHRKLIMSYGIKLAASWNHSM